MATSQHTAHTRRTVRRGPIFILLAAVFTAGLAAFLHAAAPTETSSHEVEELEGMDERVKPSNRPSVQATFLSESYRPGGVARLLILARAPRVTIRVFRAGLETERITARDLMGGRPVTPSRAIGSVAGRRTIRVPIGKWSTGFYFVKLTAPGGRVGFAPFVLRPRRLGEHRVAVVMPTHTWQAYNFRDDDHDGKFDTWYAGGSTARLYRPFSDTRGVPPHYKYYDAPFLRWLAQTGHSVDYLAQDDLDRGVSGKALARRYALIIFPGHHEYVTTSEYNAIVGFRNHGGNLMFLSANNFFWKITKRGGLMTRIKQWRDLGRPEAALIGVQYFHNDMGQHRGPYVVRTAIPWLFERTKLKKGSRFGSGGIEADRIYPSSPRNVQIVAEIPDLYGPGMDAQMTYYDQKGAKVFAGGSFTMAGGVWWPDYRRMVENLWTRLANDTDTGEESLQDAKELDE